jgi:hypothetical protein
MPSGTLRSRTSSNYQFLPAQPRNLMNDIVQATSSSVDVQQLGLAIRLNDDPVYNVTFSLTPRSATL